MPTAPLRPCAQAGCPQLVPKGRCQEHARQQDQRRGTAQQRGYDAPWAAYSRRFRAAHPLCGERADGTLDPVHSRCVYREDGRLYSRGVAACVDHTIPMSQGGSKWDENNHMSACLECNTWKANTLESARGRGDRILATEAR